MAAVASWSKVNAWTLSERSRLPGPTSPVSPRLACWRASPRRSPGGTLGSRHLGGSDVAGVAGAAGRDCDQSAARRGRPRHRRRTFDGRGTDLRREPGGRHRGADVCRGPVSRDLRRKDGAARDDGAAVAGAAHGDPPPRRATRRGCRRRRLARRPATHPTGRCGAGRWHGGRRCRRCSTSRRLRANRSRSRRSRASPSSAARRMPARRSI